MVVVGAAVVGGTEVVDVGVGIGAGGGAGVGVHAAAVAATAATPAPSNTERRLRVRGMVWVSSSLSVTGAAFGDDSIAVLVLRSATVAMASSCQIARLFDVKKTFRKVSDRLTLSGWISPD